MLYVDGMNGVIQHIETIQWLYSLISSKVSKISALVFNLQHIYTVCPQNSISENLTNSYTSKTKTRDFWKLPSATLEVYFVNV